MNANSATGLLYRQQDGVAADAVYRDHNGRIPWAKAGGHVSVDLVEANEGGGKAAIANGCGESSDSDDRFDDGRGRSCIASAIVLRRRYCAEAGTVYEHGLTRGGWMSGIRQLEIGMKDRAEGVASGAIGEGAGLG